MMYACYEMLWRIRRLREERVAAAMAIVVAARKSGKSTDAGNSGMTITDPSTTASMCTRLGPSNRYEIVFGAIIVMLAGIAPVALAWKATVNRVPLPWAGPPERKPHGMSDI